MAEQLLAYSERAVVAAGGSSEARRPGDRIPFHWPPHPVSYEFHLQPSDWREQACFEAHGETFPVSVAHTPHGVFARAETIWHEERGADLEEALENLRETSEPLFRRQIAMASALERPGRFTGQLRDLQPLDLIKLFYADDRDVAHEARVEIETHARQTDFLPGLLAVLRDTRHPNRRSAQWCVLDLFETLPLYVKNPLQEKEAVEAMKELLWTAENDYARAVYKAGVVLGGHIPYGYGAEALLEAIDAPSKYGRRSAIHGLYHVVEWIPTMRGRVVAALRHHARLEPDPQLREFAVQMSSDIERSADHVDEPVFPEER
ncbi:hypothetical protein EON81_18480 [bacterium]|nr:MAG: hypothetical protein EON81_18480 [bacterium]